MFVNLASDPIVDRLLVPVMGLAVAERFAVEEGKRVLVLLTDMTDYADAMEEVGIAMEAVPTNRGYMGDLNINRFLSLDLVRVTIETWRQNDNHPRQHKSRAQITPARYVTLHSKTFFSNMAYPNW
jgi:hypothetical protein